MNKKWIAALTASVLSASNATAQEATVLKTQQDKVSYSIGVDIANNLKQQGLEVQPDALIRGLKDQMAGSSLLMNQEEMRTVLTDFHKEMMNKHAETMKKAAEDNKKEGEAFLAQNKAKEGVVTLPSGLQYKILKAGAGKKPGKNDSVECHYRGTLINGKEFDSSYSRGQPTTFPVSGVIPGWTEALQLMPVGSKWQLFIPSELAYGPRGAGGAIGPNAALVFEVELLAIK